MSRDIFVYTCLEDYCHAGWETYTPAPVCVECGSPEIEVDHTYLDTTSEYTGLGGGR